MLLASNAIAEVRSFVARENFSQEIQRLTIARDFAELEARAEDLWQNKTRSPSGVWQQSLFYTAMGKGFEASIANDAAWKSVDKTLSLLAKQRPRSRSATLIHSTAIQQNAWRLRGLGFASTTTPEGRAAFKREILRARALLDSRKVDLSVNPEWFAQRILLATYSAEGPVAVERLFAEAVQLEPLYYQTYFNTLFFYSPRWGGSLDQMAAFMNRSIKYTTAKEGLSMYARLAWFADGNGDYQVIEEPAVDWEIMKKSFDDVLNSFPDDWNAQQFLLMACTRPDLSTAKRLVRFVKEEPSAALLGRNVSLFRSCRDLALGTGRPFVVRDRTTGEMKEVR